MDDVSYQDEIVAVLKKVIYNESGEVRKCDVSYQSQDSNNCFSFQIFCSLVHQVLARRRLYWPRRVRCSGTYSYSTQFNIF